MDSRKNSCRISYRYSPCGEHKYRLLPLRPLAKPKVAKLVYSDELQECALQVNRTTSRAGFGATPRTTSFTKLAKARVRAGCAILDKAFGKQCLFTTGTIPGSTGSAFEAVAAWSAYLVERLRQCVRDEIGEVQSVFVWEFQKRGALHLHCVFGSSDSVALERVRQSWHRWWCALLETVCDKAGVDVFAREDGHTWRYLPQFVRCDAQYVKKSVGRYLSKYLSKSAGSVADSGFWCPARWWSIDRKTRDAITKETIVTFSKRLPYVFAKKVFAELTTQMSLLSEKFFCWRNKYEPFARTFVCWLPPTPA